MTDTKKMATEKPESEESCCSQPKAKENKNLNKEEKNAEMTGTQDRADNQSCSPQGSKQGSQQSMKKDHQCSQ
jgi:hypothetical protein